MENKREYKKALKLLKFYRNNKTKINLFKTNDNMCFSGTIAQIGGVFNKYVVILEDEIPTKLFI